ncbi:SGNH/GDSL hydrolase family protein [Bradyrhizobium sp.]|uniref:SGNH/GDSL hydrolase family protein n=1 Tax=Bradyrhizobium sp. TaxID=376 RepID=UPI0025C3B110|nr:DUF459 domain-containing protein [Bradyrhizobium sp.]MBV8919060.1 DUF459 domain-containing protein [Bradyrhizobium sp.]
MSKPRSFLKVLTEPGPLVALAVAIALLVGIAGPASAQFFNFGGPPQQQRPSRGFGWFGSDFFQPFQPQAPKRVQQDFSHAPAPPKRDTVAERNVLVLGDAMADWLAYGLEDAYAEQPDMGVIRKHKTVSGLIRYQPKGDPADWAAAAKGILATEKPDIIVVMLGLNDRVAIREPAPDKTDKPGEKKTDKKDAKAKPDAIKPDAGKPADGKTKPDGTADDAAKASDKAADKPNDKADDKGADAEQDDADSDAPQAAPERAARSPNGLYEFRDERWIELYSKKIEEMIAVLKSKGVPVIWVGLPAIRGQKGTSDMLFLDSLYRDAAGKAGITYVDVWDGFVDESGRFLQRGPDFEGQPRKLRADDGVYFTQAGARKLAHYVEREIGRLLATRTSPVALPSEPATPDANAVPGQPAPRPLAGPILPLVASSVSADQLLGGPGTRPAAVDALAARTLVKGEALSPPAGRADDFAWPRREIGSELAKEPAKGDTPVASTAPTDGATPAAAAAVPKQVKRPPAAAPAQAAAPPPPRSFFGAGSGPRQPAPPRANPPGVLRPPGVVGRAAAAPPGDFSRLW